MKAQGRRAAGPVWADWFLELEEMLERRKATRSRHKRPSSSQRDGTAGGRARGN
jgi:hypothetical protein